MRTSITENSEAPTAKPIHPPTLAEIEIFKIKNYVFWFVFFCYDICSVNICTYSIKLQLSFNSFMLTYEVEESLLEHGFSDEVERFKVELQQHCFAKKIWIG